MPGRKQVPEPILITDSQSNVIFALRFLLAVVANLFWYCDGLPQVTFEWLLEGSNIRYLFKIEKYWIKCLDKWNKAYCPFIFGATEVQEICSGYKNCYS